MAFRLGICRGFRVRFRLLEVFLWETKIRSKLRGVRGPNLGFFGEFQKKKFVDLVGGGGKAIDGRILGWDGFFNGFLRERGESLERREKEVERERKRFKKRVLLAYIVHLKRRHFGHLNSPRSTRLASGSPDPIAPDPNLLTWSLLTRLTLTPSCICRVFCTFLTRLRSCFFFCYFYSILFYFIC